MAQGLHISRVAVGVEAAVADEIVEQNVGYLPWVLGENLAQQITEHVRQARTGYFPALDFFRASDAVDPALLLLTDEVARFCVEYARRELRRRLSRAFSNVAIEQAQCTAYTMPRIRPGNSDSHEHLARHYAPGRVKLELILAAIERVENPEAEAFAAHRVRHCASAPFETLEITSTRLL